MPGPVPHRKPYWTRERMIEAGARFYLERNCAPTNEGWWQAETSFTGATADGRTNLGSKRPYPSTGPLKNYWKGMRDFWTAVAAAHPELGMVLDRGDAAWTNLEEWFITETVGLLPRSEVALLMSESGLGRTEPAIRRRLYELGINSYNRWGWTVNHLARVIGVSGPVIEKYMDHGLLPFFQGNRCLYIEPADFLVIQEYDWSKRRQPRELEEAVRESLMQRLCYALLRFEWRKFSYHKIQPRRQFFTGRIKNPRTASAPNEPRPGHIRVGDWIAIIGEWARQPGAKGRIGQIKNLTWSPQQRSATQKHPARPACWIVTVEFRKLKAHGRPEYPRVRYNVPAASVMKVRKPYERKKDLKKDGRNRVPRLKRMRVAGADVLASRLNVVRGLSRG